MRWSEEEDRIVLDEMKNYGRCWVELAKSTIKKLIHY
jgi:hypothetical protein